MIFRNNKIIKMKKKILKNKRKEYRESHYIYKSIYKKQKNQKIIKDNNFKNRKSKDKILYLKIN